MTRGLVLAVIALPPLDSFVDSRYFFQLYYGMLALAAVGLAVGIRWGWRAEPKNDAPVGKRLHWGLRWLIIAALCGIEAYYLWPHTI